MKKKESKLDLDRLIQGINTIISGSRSSLLDWKVNLLEEVVFTLEKFSKERVKKKRIDLMISVCEILLRFFDNDIIDKIKNYF